LPGEDRLTAALDDQPRRHRPRRRAVDAAGIDVPLARGVQDMSLAHFRSSPLLITAVVPFSTVRWLEWRESFGIQPNAT
jgi:hypothetical protein